MVCDQQHVLLQTYLETDFFFLFSWWGSGLYLVLLSIISPNFWVRWGESGVWSCTRTMSHFQRWENTFWFYKCLICVGVSANLPGYPFVWIGLCGCLAPWALFWRVAAVTQHSFGLCLTSLSFFLLFHRNGNKKSRLVLRAFLLQVFITVVLFRKPVIMNGRLLMTTIGQWIWPSFKGIFTQK